MNEILRKVKGHDCSPPPKNRHHSSGWNERIITSFFSEENSKCFSNRLHKHDQMLSILPYISSFPYFNSQPECCVHTEHPDPLDKRLPVLRGGGTRRGEVTERGHSQETGQSEILTLIRRLVGYASSPTNTEWEEPELRGGQDSVRQSTTRSDNQYRK